MKIRAAVLERPGAPFRIETLDLAPPGPGEVLVRIEACGVCHSDWHLVTGATRHPFPCVAGHEGAGVVERLGPGVERLAVGQKVALSWAPDCGECFYCRRDKPNLCAAFAETLWAGVMLDGRPRLSRAGEPVYHYCGLAAFAEAATVPAVACVPIPDRIPSKVAALVGCAVATGVGATISTVRVAPGDSVAVFGCGGVGLSILMGARLAGATELVAIDRSPAREAAARDFGATAFVLADADPI
ncbi:MAG TPA: alcohol dehydrogenase catalytic domain-containing protein, partial [Planctomycetia bacterium]|nr:alcohol dehydrogenase catalytic domain-containing protein [Planctomycetia bacterium]